MKANKPKAEDKKYFWTTPVDLREDEVVKKRGTYVSKSAYGKLQTAHKKLDKFIAGYTKEHYILESDYYAIKSDNTKLIKIKDDLVVCYGKLESENSELKSSFSQLAEENKENKKIISMQQIEFNNCSSQNADYYAEIQEEVKIAKFNFRWAMIATAAFILSIIYILIH